MINTSDFSTNTLIYDKNPVSINEQVTFKERLAQFFQTRRFHFIIIGIVFLDLSLLLVGLVLAIYGTPSALLANFILFLFSWTFPSIFIIETCLKIWIAGGWKSFYTTKLKIWDSIILAFSVISDIMLYVLLMEHASATATAVIIFRLWKIIRLFHGFTHIIEMKYESKQLQLKQDNNHLQAKIESLIMENAQLRSTNNTSPV